MCRSDRCRMRNGSASGSRTGTSKRRNVNMLRSTSEAYAKVAPPSAVIPAASEIAVRLRMRARVVSPFMGTLKDRLNEDLRTAMKGRDELTLSTLRMALSAVRNAEVSGEAARDLTDDEVTAVLTKEAKKRREASAAFADAGRADQAARETAEGEVLDRYLPKQLSDEEIAEIVA